MGRELLNLVARKHTVPILYAAAKARPEKGYTSNRKIREFLEWSRFEAPSQQQTSTFTRELAEAGLLQEEWSPGWGSKRFFITKEGARVLGIALEILALPDPTETDPEPITRNENHA